MITNTDNDICNAFIDYFTNVFTKNNEFNKNNIPFELCNSVMLNFIIKRNEEYEK